MANISTGRDYLMSAKYTFLAWDTPVKDASTKLALLQLANNADDNGFSYYSISKMANACDMSDRNFMRKIKELESMKVLTVERRANRPSLYTLIGDEMGVTLCHLHSSEVTGCHAEVTGCHAEGDRLSHDPNSYPVNSPESIFMCEKTLEQGFEIFYSAGLVKKSKAQAYKKFKSLSKKMKADPIEFGQLLAQDVQTRIAKQQYGIDKLHPSTYLNNERWTDEHEENNNGQFAPTGKQSAAERINARNSAKYGQPSSGLGMGESSGDLRGAMGEGERRNAITHVETSAEQDGSISCEEWD